MRAHTVYACLSLSLLLCSMSAGALSGQVEVVVAEDSSTCRSCISLSPTVLLGDDPGEGYLEQRGSLVAMDGLDRFWVSHRGGPKVYGSDGAFVRQMGSFGEGPGEFRRLTWIHEGVDGRVRVFDAGNGRVTVFDHDGDLLWEQRLPGVVLSAAPADERSFAAVFGSVIPGRIGSPVHVISERNGEFLQSFRGGSGAGDFDSHSFVVMGDENVVVVDADTYEMMVWDRAGALRSRITRPGLLRKVRTRSGEVTPSSFIVRAHMADDGLLWVLAYVVREDWRQNVTPVRRGGRTYYDREDATDVHVTVIEVIDLKEGRIVAQQRFHDITLYGFLRGRRAYGPATSEIGEPFIRIYTVRSSIFPTSGG